MANISTTNDPSNAVTALPSPPPPPPVQPASATPLASDSTPRVSQAVGDVRGALRGSGMFREVTNDDLHTVQNTMNKLDQREASQTFGALSDRELSTLGEAMNQRSYSTLPPESPGYGVFPPAQTGFSASEKQGFMNDAAQRLDGTQLARLSANFEKDDVRPLGSAIAANAPATAKADYVAEMGRTGQIQRGYETKATFGSATLTDGTPQTQAVSDVLTSLNGQPGAFDKAVAGLSDDQLRTVVRAGLGSTAVTTTLGGASESFQADRLAALQRTAEQTGSQATRARVLGEINDAIDGLKPGQQVNLSDGGSLKPSIIPSIPPTQEQIAAKRAEVTEQHQRVDALRKLGTPEATAKADQLQEQYDAKEKASLAADAYHWVDKTMQSVPVGYTRASEDPQTLAKYGLKQSDLAPTTSGFRAELYIPDKSIFGTDAKPVLAFKGTTPTRVEDWVTNAGQADGKPTDYYNRAMSIAREVNQRTDGNFEITGHSLGGGQASAAAAVTGAKATTFNASGLHENTARDFVQKNGGRVFDTSQRVTAYQVQGDLITSFQEAAKTIDPARADQVGQIVRFAAGMGGNPFVKGGIEQFIGRIGDIGVLRNAQGSELRGIPEAAGTHIKLDALEADGSPRRQAAAQLTGPDGLIQHAQTLMDRFDANVARLDRASSMPSEFPESQQAANRIDAGMQAYSEFKADPVLQQAKSGFGESVARHLMDTVQTGMDARTHVLERQAEQLLTAGR